MTSSCCSIVSVDHNEGLDGAAGDWVEVVAEEISTRVMHRTSWLRLILIYDHRTANDAVIGSVHIWFFCDDWVGSMTWCIVNNVLEVANLAKLCIHFARRCCYRIHPIPARSRNIVATATILSRPSSGVDMEAVGGGRTGHLVHVALDANIGAWAGLVQEEDAVWVRGRIGGIVFHLTVSSDWFKLVRFKLARLNLDHFLTRSKGSQ